MMSDNCGYDMYEIVNHASKTLLTFIANKDSFGGSKLFIYKIVSTNSAS